MSEDSLDTRVGHRTTSVLREEIKKYIISNTVNGEYEGELKYLQIYEELCKYDKQNESTSMFKGRTQGPGILKKDGMFWK